MNKEETKVLSIEELVKIQAIEFADYTRQFSSMSNLGMWSKSNGDVIPASHYTTSELYEMYLQSKTLNK